MKNRKSKHKKRTGQKSRKPAKPIASKRRNASAEKRKITIPEKDFEKILGPYIRNYLRAGRVSEDRKYARFHRYPMETAYDDLKTRFDRRERKLDDFYARVYSDQKGYIKELVELLREERKGSYKALETLIKGLFGYSPKHKARKHKPNEVPPVQPTAPVQTTPTAPVQTTPTAPVQTTPTAPVQTTPTAPVQTTPTAPVQTTPTAQLIDYTYHVTNDRITKYRRMTASEFISAVFTGLRGCDSYGVIEPYMLLTDYFEHPDYFSNITNDASQTESVRKELEWIDGHQYGGKKIPELLASKKLARSLISNFSSRERHKNKSVVFDTNAREGEVRIARALARLYDIQPGDLVSVVFTGYSDREPQITGCEAVIEDRIRIETPSTDKYLIVENRSDAIAVNPEYLKGIDNTRVQGSNFSSFDFYLEKVT